MRLQITEQQASGLVTRRTVPRNDHPDYEVDISPLGINDYM